MTILQCQQLVVHGLTGSPKPSQQRVVLIGGGHAHVQVIKALNTKSRPSDMHVTLIDVQKSASYSGMVPGCISKLYTPEQTLLHLEPLTDWAGIDFINDEVVDMDLQNNCISLRNSDEPIRFDVVSIDIGSTSRGLDEIPGVRTYTIPTRPISRLVQRIEQAEEHICSNPDPALPLHVVVVGGGAAGIELAMSMVGRWRPLLGARGLRVTLLDVGTELLPMESSECRAAVRRVMKERGIQVRHKCQVQQVTKDLVCLESGELIPYTHCIWATGAAAHPLARTLHQRGLAINERGWIRVQPNLQSPSHPCVFAAGDCSSMEPIPPPKAGVYAVRAGPILIENLTNFLQHKPLVQYVPQDDFLKLLVCGDGTALGFRFGIPIYGKWVFELKDAIDQKFMGLFKRENLPDLSEPGRYDTSQYDEIKEEKFARLEPEEAAELLQRTDDGVNYEQAWKVLRDMTADVEYRMNVLSCIDVPELVGVSGGHMDN